MIKNHDSSPWWIIYRKNPVLVGNIKKAQFLLAISKSPVLAGNIKKPSSHWQIQKVQFLLAISESTILIGNIKKPNSYWYYLVKKSNIVNTWEIPYD